AFEALEAAFEAEHSDIDIRLNFAGSQTLRLQLEQGAAADVFASADPSHMDALVQAGLAGEPQTFARNSLVVVVPRDNPADIDTFEDLGAARTLVVGNDAVPIGRYTQALLDRARTRLGDRFVERIDDAVVSRENNVRLVLAKVVLGEADAAI